MLDTAPLYSQVAEQIHALIRAGTLRAGERVPSVRRLSHQQGVSVATVLQAYQRLEDAGVIEARPQSGYYVRRAARWNGAAASTTATWCLPTAAWKR
jgi:DNA-binding transcriptional regulator YhcF (GntR family)